MVAEKLSVNMEVGGVIGAYTKRNNGTVDPD